MSKKIILSKETYFNRPKSTMTLADWEAYKQAHPQAHYVGEDCWALHDTMLMRNKSMDDSSISKVLLREAGIEYVKNVDYLKITSDLSGLDILVEEIEDDELLIQLEAAGAKVLYITSNPNYGMQIPEKYFAMYPAETGYDIEDYPAVDKRHLFVGKNIFVKYINFLDYKVKDKFKNLLETTIKENDMVIDKVLMNPPYDGSLHLEILDNTLNVVRKINPNAEISTIQPVRWLEDPLAEYKQGTDYKKYKDSIVKKISKLQLVDATTACKAFNIMNATDLGIYTFTNKSEAIIVNNQQALINKLLSKLDNITKLADKVEQNKIDGYRCEVKKLTSGTGGHNLGDADSSKVADVHIVWGPYTNGYDINNKFFNTTRSTNQFTKNYFANSIQFNALSEAKNFNESCNTNFYRRLIHLFKWDVNVPLRFLPYMEDYSKAWTDEDYCEFFGLTPEESEFMCRTVDDYRIKDFVNYIKFED